MRNILHIPEPCKYTDAETVRDLMVAYVASESCSPAERLDFEIHCLLCDECGAMLAIIQDLLRSSVNEEDEKTLAGMEAAGVAWRRSITEAPTSDSGHDLRRAA